MIDFSEKGADRRIVVPVWYELGRIKIVLAEEQLK